MKTLQYSTANQSKKYDDLLKDLYTGAKQKVGELVIPPVKILAVEGNQPPASRQYQDAIACLFGVGYTLKMGLKFEKLARPKGYFDYKVGALETLWWSTKGAAFQVSDPKTLRWKAYVMVPAFVDAKVLREAISQAKAKKPEVPYEQVKLEELSEGHSLQILHLGPYDKEGPTIELLNEHMKSEGLKWKGKHHEIYVSDPRRAKPEKLKTVIRVPVGK